jgi:TPP-dependent pyruvate/acetoin dehydrogenase alpha subunit
VPKELLEKWQKKDPIARFEKLLRKKGWWVPIDERIQKEIAEDLAFAEASPMPDGELARQGVFCD